MATVSVKPGSAGPFVVQIAGDDGEVWSDLPRELRIDAGDACVVVPTEWDGEYWVADLNTLTLPPRLYPVSVYYETGGQWRLADQFNLLIDGGC